MCCYVANVWGLCTTYVHNLLKQRSLLLGCVMEVISIWHVGPNLATTTVTRREVSFPNWGTVRGGKEVTEVFYLNCHLHQSHTWIKEARSSFLSPLYPFNRGAFIPGLRHRIVWCWSYDEVNREQTPRGHFPVLLEAKRFSKSQQFSQSCH